MEMNQDLQFFATLADLTHLADTSFILGKLSCGLGSVSLEEFRRIDSEVFRLWYPGE